MNYIFLFFKIISMEKRNVYKFWYCRKSTESDEKQIQSIESQKSWMIWLLWDDFKEVKIFSESKSAKEPNKRQEFQNLIKEIEKISKNKKWDFEIWIYAWWLDRLSRNPVDSGLIQYFMQIWKIHKIICYDKTYNPEDSGIFMWMINAMSNQFILDLQKNVKRWMRDKANKGWCIQRTPNWYTNNRITKEADIDENLVPIVKEIFSLRDEWYSLTEIAKICKKNWYKTKYWTDFTRTWIDKMIKNPFYIGFQKNEWELKKWKHKTFIDIELWERLNNFTFQTSRISEDIFPLKWLVKNFYTWKPLVWVRKTKTMKSTWETKEYIYYATHNTEDVNIRVSISQNEIIEHFDNIISKYEINSKIRPIFSEAIKKTFQNLFFEVEEKRKSINNLISEANKKANRLFALVCSSTISEERYKEENNIITLDLEKYNQELKKLWQKNIALNEETLFFVELMEDLSAKRKTWDNDKKLKLIKIMLVELKIDNKKELFLQETKLFELLKISLGLDWYSQGDLNPCFHRERVES